LFREVGDERPLVELRSPALTGGVVHSSKLIGNQSCKKCS